MSRTTRLIQFISILACLGPVCIPLDAQTALPEAEATGQNVGEEENVVTYPSSFFSRYQPNSALDMLKQLPGFIMAVSGELRGYALRIDRPIRPKLLPQR